MQHLLVISAHPDDETFMAGGTIALLSQAGWQVDLVCATRGEAGDRGPLVNLAREKVGDVRQKELEEAGAVLGIHAITFLGYKDGTLKERTPGDIEDVIYKKMEEVVPDIVITFDTTGISHHPDHIKLSYATTYAFQKYAKWIEKKLENEEPTTQIFPKLYYAAVPESIVAYAVKRKILAPESFGKPLKGVPDKKITTVIDVREAADTKRKALNKYITQRKNVEQYLGLPLMNNEYFIFRMHGTTEVYFGKNDQVASSL